MIETLQKFKELVNAADEGYEVGLFIFVYQRFQ